MSDRKTPETSGTRRWLLSVTGVALALLIAACGSSGETGGDTTSGGTSAPDAELREVTVISPSGNSPGFAALYVARQLGYFADEGLEVIIESGSGSSEAIQLLIAGQGEFALAGVEALMVAIDGGAEVSAAYELYSKPSFGLVVPSGSEITEIGQLAGTTIGITELAGGEVPVVVGLLTDEGIPLDDVEIVPVGSQTPSVVEALDSGRIDAFGGSTTDFAGMSASGYEVTPLTTDKTEDFPGGAIAVRRDVLAEDPDMVVAFFRAWAKGQHAVVSVDGVSEAAMKIETPELWEDEEAGQARVDSFRPLLELDEGQDLYGLYSRQAWADYVHYLSLTLPGQEPFIQDPEGFDVESAVIVEYVEDYNDFDHAEVVADAEAYLAENS